MSVQETLSISQGSRVAGGVSLNTRKNTPLAPIQNAPIDLLGHWRRSKRRYTKKQEIATLAIDKYKKDGLGITFNDLLSNGVSYHKEHAQDTLKRCLGNNVLFTMANHKPQQYYPISLKAEILRRKMSKNAPVGVTGVGYSKAPLFPSNRSINSSAVDSDHNPILGGLCLATAAFSTIAYSQDPV